MCAALHGLSPCLAAGVEMLSRYANVDEAYDMNPEDLCAKISLSDALIVRSATKVGEQAAGFRYHMGSGWQCGTLVLCPP